MATEREKPLIAILTNSGTYDLMIERDAGNPVRILMGGNIKDNEEYWNRISLLADKVLDELALEQYWDKQPEVKG